MTSGVLMYCFDTPETQYSKIANRSIGLVEKYLDLPVTVVTDEQTADNLTASCDIIKMNVDKTNTKLSKPWYNLERHLAYDHSPFDNTIVIDADYFCFSNKLKNLLNTEHDFLIHQTAHDVTDRNNMLYQRESMLDLVWATVLIFKKSAKAKAVFDTVKLVKQNYSHFCNLYRISYGYFRNDYAFAIALNQINGHSTYDCIPDSIATVPTDAKISKISDRGVVIEHDDRIFTIMDHDLHILNKEVADV